MSNDEPSDDQKQKLLKSDCPDPDAWPDAKTKTLKPSDESSDDVKQKSLKYVGPDPVDARPDTKQKTLKSNPTTNLKAKLCMKNVRAPIVDEFTGAFITAGAKSATNSASTSTKTTTASTSETARPDAKQPALHDGVKRVRFQHSPNAFAATDSNLANSQPSLIVSGAVDNNLGDSQPSQNVPIAIDDEDDESGAMPGMLDNGFDPRRDPKVLAALHAGQILKSDGTVLLPHEFEAECEMDYGPLPQGIG